MLDTIRERLRAIDPKLLGTAATTLVVALIVRAGLDLDDPLVVALVPVLAGALVGFVVPNAATGAADRWTPFTPPAADAELDDDALGIGATTVPLTADRSTEG